MTAGNALLEITRERDAFRLSGEIDLSNVDQLATALSPEVRDGNHLVLDCSDLGFIDSTGMAALLAICKGLGVSGRLTLRTVPSPVAKAAHVLGLDRVPNLKFTDARSGPGIAASA
ncbi:MAG: STAS domain-containing protein [Actinomycetota bacterium]